MEVARLVGRYGRQGAIDGQVPASYEVATRELWGISVAVPRQRKQGLNRGAAKERILLSAENLFAESGLNGVSYRDLATAAGVSLSATHYYFGSKHAVLAEVFARKAKMMTDRRATLLGDVLAEEGIPSLEAILDAFLRPAFEVTRGDRNDPFNKLRARLAVEQNEGARESL